ncbi:hypothetical protein GQ53DRAFT_133308 [Thozetella sp. PMI_491]|nr:hypothetical protein GQ53DRAFT_133308 [Thozetella sp. PMI_491]
MTWLEANYEREREGVARSALALVGICFAAACVWEASIVVAGVSFRCVSPGVDPCVGRYLKPFVTLSRLESLKCGWVSACPPAPEALVGNQNDARRRRRGSSLGVANARQRSVPPVWCHGGED